MGRHRTDELDDGYRAHETGPRRRSGGGGRGKVLVPLAGAVALAVLLGVAAFVIFNRDHSCSAGKIALRVTASPDIQPALSKIAGSYNKASHSIDDKCVEVAVAKEATAKTAVTLAAGKLATDLWVADSSLVIARLRGDEAGAGLPAPSGSIAQSPILLAAPKAAAAKLAGSLGEPSWSGLIAASNVANQTDGLGKKIRVLALDPAKSSAGLGALLSAAGAAKEADVGEKQLLGALKQLSRQLVGDPAALLASMTVKSADKKVPVGVATEQNIWAHNAKKPDALVVPLYPAEGTLSLDFPALVLTKDAQVQKAAAAFQKELAGDSAKKVLRDYGFRTPDGKGGTALSKGEGFQVEAPQPLAAPDAKTVASLSQTWSRLNLGTRLLALLDVSGTMALPVPGTQMTRMQAISKIATEGMSLYEANAEIGAWAFSTHLDGQGKDYKELVPVGPLSETVNGVLRKQALAQQLATVQAKATGDTGLNDTLKAAYQEMMDGYQKDKINVLLVLTDGAGNDDPQGGVKNDELLEYLKAEFDPKRPVSILLIAFGPDAVKGKKEMDAIAQATAGEAFIAKNILQVRDVFLEGMKRRLCAPRCDG